VTGAAAHMSLHLTNNVKEPGTVSDPVLASGESGADAKPGLVGRVPRPR
jgi:hypothetical protein